MAVCHYVCRAFYKRSVKWVWTVASSQLLLSLSSGATLLRDVALARQRKWTFFALAFCNVVPLFFLKSGTLIFDFFCIIIIDVCFHSGFALPSLWVRSAFAPMSGGKEYSKRYEIDFTITIYRIENWLARRMAKGSLLCNVMIMSAIDGIGRGCRRVMCGVYYAVD